MARMSDHPRACGENYSFSSIMSTQNGSPPRMRGKLFFSLEQSRLERITPAHAGKTTESEAQAPLFSDHPRACGENSDMMMTKSKRVGSPPRMRGKLMRPSTITIS